MLKRIKLLLQGHQCQYKYLERRYEKLVTCGFNVYKCTCGDEIWIVEQELH